MFENFTRATRERIIMLLVSSNLVDILDKTADVKGIFGSKGWGYLKMARSFIQKAMLEELPKHIDKTEASRLRRLSEGSTTYLVNKAAPEPKKGHKHVPEEELYDLAAMAIGNGCVNCKITKYKKCDKFTTLQALDIPAAQEDCKNKCPYLVEIEESEPT